MTVGGMFPITFSWIAQRNYSAFYSRRMKISWLRQITAREQRTILLESYTRTNYTFPSVLAFASSLLRLRIQRTSLTALNTCHCEILIGRGGVGKTTLIHRLETDKYKEFKRKSRGVRFRLFQS
jgi:hypothetical protein